MSSADTGGNGSSTGGYLGLVLHAHLPFVRHPEHDDFLEEDWLFEAISETYVPLLQAFFRLRDQRVRFRVTMSITPPLAAMLDDQLLRTRYDRHLSRLTKLAESEVRGNHESSSLGRIARHYLDRFRGVRAFLDRWGGDLLAAFRELQNDGLLEILACNATHGFLPLMSGPAPRRAQIRAGVQAYARTFGRRPRGIWLAECGYDHGVDALLGEEGIDYFFVDSHGIGWGRPHPQRGIHAPVRTPGGPAAFARDLETGRQVWSADEGYPGDPAYREFYRDLGWDASYEYIRPYLHEDGVRRGVGIKCHRVTGKVPLHEKQLYEPDVAEARAREHARNFVFNRKHQIRHLRTRLDRPPLVVAMYDAELFGHWWYEGPIFLEEVLRALAEEPEVEAITAPEYLARHRDLQLQRPNPSTWGAGRLALPLPALGRAGDGHPRPEVRGHGRLDAAGAGAGRARALAHAELRLGVHHHHRHHRPLRGAPVQAPPCQFPRIASGVDRRRARRGRRQCARKPHADLSRARRQPLVRHLTFPDERAP
jgi:1,4-alpha-glucan branching enzyme